MKVLSLFSGIGAFEKALKNIGIQFELAGYCEIDKYASRAYSLIHNVPESMNLGDITKVDTAALGRIDMITYGFPCQDISNAGKQKGFEDENGERTRSGLFFEALRIIEDTQPKFAICENVKALTCKKFAKEFQTVLDSLESAGYVNYWQVLNAKDYGVPQNRERVFIVSIRKDIDWGICWPSPFQLELRLDDVLEHIDVTGPAPDEAVIASVKALGDISYCIDASYWNGASVETFLKKHRRQLVVDGRQIRKLTPKECFRLMGFDDADHDVLVKNGISNTQIYKMAGNSIVVDVLEYLFLNLAEKYYGEMVEQREVKAG